MGLTVANEAHLELLLGRHVHDVDGVRVGRLEEFVVDRIDGEDVVTEFHIGGAAALERVLTFAAQLPLVRLFPFTLTEYRVSWKDMDLSDTRHPRLRVRRADIARTPRDSRT